jgi:hypothetical protein
VPFLASQAAAQGKARAHLQPVKQSMDKHRVPTT